MVAQAIAPTSTLTDFISLDGMGPATLRDILQLAAYLKRRGRGEPPSDSPLLGRSVALLFEKPSLRTRTTFQVGVRQLGGDTVYLGKDEVNLGVRETVADVARNLERWVDLIIVRTFDHARVLELADHAGVPVINALSDHEHPCQVLADLLSLEERLGPLSGLTLAYVGDGNNVVHSLAFGAAAMGMHLRIGTPPGYEPDPLVIARAAAQARGGSIRLTHDPLEAVAGAHAVYTDSWVSMGQEDQHATRLAAFKGFQVNEALMAGARAGALFLHCLPAHRGEEVTNSVIDGPTSVVFDQAENRLHAQKALMSLLAYT
ncbi:MAG TPA: ornithine carbamoyltransferase [Chloroflexota bacterium]|nr:ornithine carbamoyltransferase [Chloroflexota bacterium]